MESSHTFKSPAWISGQADKEARTDIMPVSERRGQIGAIVGFVILVVFLALHHFRATGFFTEDFDTIAAILLIASIAYGLVPILARFITGRKNHPARLLEAYGMALFLVAQLYLLVTFPFDMTHFADPLPQSLEFLLDWVSATLAKWILGIGTVGGATFMVYDFFLYAAVKERLMKLRVPAEKPSE